MISTGPSLTKGQMFSYHVCQECHVSICPKPILSTCSHQCSQLLGCQWWRCHELCVWSQSSEDYIRVTKGSRWHVRHNQRFLSLDIQFNFGSLDNIHGTEEDRCDDGDTDHRYHFSHALHQWDQQDEMDISRDSEFSDPGLNIYISLFWFIIDSFCTGSKIDVHSDVGLVNPNSTPVPPSGPTSDINSTATVEIFRIANRWILDASPLSLLA